MQIGTIKNNEETIRLDIDIKCTNCGKTVPGRIKTSKNYSKTDEFEKEVSQLKRNYLCGICRDKKRVNQK